MSKGLEYLQQIKNEYIYFGGSNKLGLTKSNTHYEQFRYILMLLNEDEYAKQIINIILHNYDSYYSNKTKYKKRNVNNPFYLLEQKIEEKENNHD